MYKLGPANSQSGCPSLIGLFLMLNNWKQRAGTVKRDGHALYLAARDPRVPWYAKALAIAVAAYALSPIDLIPDFVPVLGYVDDLIIVPAGIAFVIRLIPPEIMTQHRDIAIAAQDRPVSLAAGVMIVTIWIVAIGLTLWIAMRYLVPGPSGQLAGSTMLSRR
jgi:uncharacterized membrane protein YkvA (DUF1232 family)